MTSKIKFNTFQRSTDLLQVRFEGILQAITKLEAATQDTPVTQSQLRTLTTYLAETKRKYLDWENSFSRTLELDEAEAPKATLAKIQTTIEDLYIRIVCAIEGLIPVEATPPSPGGQSVHDLPVALAPNVRLPKIALKTFSGDLSEWINFINLYDTSVHMNTSLQAVTKFQYLVSTLQGPALSLVSSLSITAANYQLAYQTLRDRFHNSRRLISLHLNAILDLCNIADGNTKQLRKFIDTLNQNTQALRTLQVDLITLNNPFLAAHLLRRLDNDLRRKLESYRISQENFQPHSLPTVDEINGFLTQECTVTEDIDLHIGGTSRSNKDIATVPKFSRLPAGPKPSNAAKHISMVTTENHQYRKSSSPPRYTCFVCKESHRIYGCQKFRSLSPHERYDLVKQNKNCISCLGTHDLRDCKSKETCRTCHKKHHTMLHFETNPSNDSKKSPQTPIQNSVSLTTQMPLTAATSDSTVLLGTCLIQLTAANGVSHVFRALLDSASMTDFITERAAQLLGAPRQRSNIAISGISQTMASTHGMLLLAVKNLSSQPLAFDQPFFVLDKITSDLPRASLPLEIFEKARKFSLADPTFHLSSRIDVLIGGSLFPHLLTGESHQLGDNLPFALGTKLGTVIIGRTPSTKPVSEMFSSVSTTLLSTSDVELHEQLQKFWVEQEVPSASQQSSDEMLCDEHFSNTHTRDIDGRYCVSLPFKPDAPVLGASRTVAETRFHALERKFAAQPAFHAKYVEFMRDYANSGHMKEIKDPSHDIPHYYIPHHGVFKQHGDVNKLRTVFDASAKTSNSLSLNEILLTGRKLQSDICNILLNFRTHNVVWSCDIKQMFRMVNVHQQDHPFQRILWRESPMEQLRTYELTTVTYGLNCSPYLALRTLRQLADDEGHHHPEAAEILRHHTYVDDAIAGCSTEEEALHLQQELIALSLKGGFQLRKWSSNSERLLQAVQEDHREPPVFLQESSQPHYSVLGLHWSPNSDFFSYHFDMKKPSITKRQILSAIAQFYDPCGFIAPVTMWCKTFMQCLWAHGTAWDDPIPNELLSKWQLFVNELIHLRQVQVPRSLHLSQAISVQLHGYCDASQVGYAAAVYFRCQLPDDSVIIRLVLAKTRVAPLKRVTLPRLELCGAHLLAQLVNYCVSVFPKVSFSKHFLWCDSTVALTWLTTPPFRLKTYVANRVAQIQESIPCHWWRHISGSENPVDIASRGILPSSLPDFDLWWQGPTWLSLPPAAWPTPKFCPLDLHSTGEVKETPLPVLVSAPAEEFELLSKYSSWTTLLRVTAYIQRFFHNARKDRPKITGPLTLSELQEAHDQVIALVQQATFTGPLDKAKLAHLSPFRDDKGLLRVGGRLEKSSMHFDAKHPLLLPKKHHVVDLLIRHYHVSHLHAGAQLTQAVITRKYWVLCARSRIRTVIRNCLTCFRHKPRHITPIMADLPSVRVSPAKVFSSTGTDYCGPFNVKVFNLRGNRTVKVYLCIFICLSIKAVHIEVVTDLTTEAFLAALTRFICRRGICTDLYSDCGTNFIGANTELKRIVKDLQAEASKETISNFATSKGIKFHFNPPSAPHFGGIWESAVKSAKHHLYRVMGDSVLTLSEFFTLATQTEAMLNSRPLTSLSSDPNDLQALTPGHFITGAPLSAVPEQNLQDIPPNRLRHFQLVQSLHQHLWKRWQHEYLHTLMQRKKWTKASTKLQVNDLVLIQMPTPPLTWPLGRVTAIHPGDDSEIRVVEVVTSKGTYKRPTVKVYPLPLEA